MIGFRVRGLRSSAKHPDATDWTAFCWGLTRGMDHFAFGFPASKRRQGKSICQDTFQCSMLLWPQPSLICIKGPARRRALNSAKKSSAADDPPIAGVRRSRGLGHCGVEIPARDRRITGVAVEILKGAKPREIRIFPSKRHYLNITKSLVPTLRLNCLSSLTRRSNDRSQTLALDPTKALFQRWDLIRLATDMSLSLITSPNRAFCRHSPHIFYSRLADLLPFLSRYLQQDCRRRAVETLSQLKHCTFSQPRRLQLPHCWSRS